MGLDGDAPNTGGAYVFLGDGYHGIPQGSIDLSEAHLTLLGVAGGDSAGASVAGLGNVMGEAYGPTLGVGAPNADDGAEDGGVVYISWTPLSGTVSLADVDGRLVGVEERGLAGLSLAAAGDVDRNGRGDILVGSPGANGGVGLAYVIGSFEY